MKLVISLNGVTHEIAPKPGDLVRFERQYDIAASALEDNPRLEYVFFIAWCAMVRLGQFDGDFEQFIDLADVGDSVPLDGQKLPS